MSIWRKLFGEKDYDENSLGNRYVPLLEKLLGLPTSDAKAMFASLLDGAKDEQRRVGAHRLPPALGELILKRAETDAEARQRLERKRADGVTDDDIRRWWNTPDLERRILIHMDNIARIAHFKACKAEGMSDEHAAANVHKHLPSFGDPDEKSPTPKGSPLPFELKYRVIEYTLKKLCEDPDGHKKAIAGHETFNSLIREGISRGEL